MCNLYDKLIFEDISAFNGEIFNLGAENLKIIEIAEIIKDLMKSRYNKKLKLGLKKVMILDHTILIQTKFRMS